MRQGAVDCFGVGGGRLVMNWWWWQMMGRKGIGHGVKGDGGAWVGMGEWGVAGC